MTTIASGGSSGERPPIFNPRAPLASLSLSLSSSSSGETISAGVITIAIPTSVCSPFPLSPGGALGSSGGGGSAAEASSSVAAAAAAAAEKNDASSSSPASGALRSFAVNTWKWSNDDSESTAARKNPPVSYPSTASSLGSAAAAAASAARLSDSNASIVASPHRASSALGSRALDRAATVARVNAPRPPCVSSQPAARRIGASSAVAQRARTRSASTRAAA
eukprot:25178-Pelagococcus_subviridis.AAC.5